MGSKLKRPLPSDKSNKSAGFPSEKEGIREMPLLVLVITPEKMAGVVVLSGFWANMEQKNGRMQIKTMAFFMR